MLSDRQHPRMEGDLSIIARSLDNTNVLQYQLLFQCRLLSKDCTDCITH
uniref:Uncharacterized protein n=1 Tax=Anguilla anguilla TaxID=7936 RepID=A0A0E9RRG8_ANGAN